MIQLSKQRCVVRRWTRQIYVIKSQPFRISDDDSFHTSKMLQQINYLETKSFLHVIYKRPPTHAKMYILDLF